MHKTTNLCSHENFSWANNLPPIVLDCCWCDRDDPVSEAATPNVFSSLAVQWLQIESSWRSPLGPPPCQTTLCGQTGSSNNTSPCVDKRKENPKMNFKIKTQKEKFQKSRFFVKYFFQIWKFKKCIFLLLTNNTVPSDWRLDIHGRKHERSCQDSGTVMLKRVGKFPVNSQTTHKIIKDGELFHQRANK